MKSMVMAFLASTLLGASVDAKQVEAKTTITPLHSVAVTDAAGLLLNGTLDVTQFMVQNGKYWAYCKVRGIFCGIDIEEMCVVPITIGDCDGGIREIQSPGNINPSVSENYTCDCIIINFQSCTVNRLTGTAIQLLPCQLRCTANEFPAEIICMISGGIREITTPMEQIASWMNQLL
jgi:hypothetical protein